MTIHLSANGTVELIGVCPLEDAELLLQQLLMSPGAPVDWGACESAHLAVIQVLLVGDSLPVGTPVNSFLKNKVASLLGRRG